MMEAKKALLAVTGVLFLAFVLAIAAAPTQVAAQSPCGTSLFTVTCPGVSTPISDLGCSSLTSTARAAFAFIVISLLVLAVGIAAGVASAMGMVPHIAALATGAVAALTLVVAMALELVLFFTSFCPDDSDHSAASSGQGGNSGTSLHDGGAHLSASFYLLVVASILAVTYTILVAVVIMRTKAAGGQPDAYRGLAKN